MVVPSVSAGLVPEWAKSPRVAQSANLVVAAAFLSSFATYFLIRAVAAGDSGYVFATAIVGIVILAVAMLLVMVALHLIQQHITTTIGEDQASEQAARVALALKELHLLAEDHTEGGR